MAKKMNLILKEEWEKLIHIRESGEELKTIFQRNFFYKCRTRTIKEYGKSEVCRYDYFKYELIDKLEKSTGHQKEELGIRAKPDATIYTRNGIELIKYQHRDFPVISIIATEKSGIAESLAEYLTQYGIYVIDTTGNQGRYPIQLVEARSKDIPIFCIEDLDITGCFMSKRFKEAGADRIDLLWIAKQLNIPEKKLWEEDAGGNKNTHWKSITETDRKLLCKKRLFRRIEIDTILDFVTPEEFAKVILNFLDEKIQIKEMSKVMDLGEWVYVPLIPKEKLQNLKDEIEDLGEEYSETAEKILEDYEEIEQPFIELDLKKLESEAKESFEEKIQEDN